QQDAVRHSSSRNIFQVSPVQCNMVLLHHLYTFFMMGIVCHCFCVNTSVVCPLYIDKSYYVRRDCHVCAGYMDGCQPDVLPYLFFSHSSVKLYVGGKSCRLPAKRDRFVTMV